jgi:uncharacterized protein YcbK (DUF882 family)
MLKMNKMRSSRSRINLTSNKVDLKGPRECELKQLAHLKTTSKLKNYTVAISQGLIKEVTCHLADILMEVMMTQAHQLRRARQKFKQTKTLLQQSIKRLASAVRDLKTTLLKNMVMKRIKLHTFKQSMKKNLL